jgi:hypothetical protein
VSEAGKVCQCCDEVIDRPRDCACTAAEFEREALASQLRIESQAEDEAAAIEERGKA